MFVCDKCGLCCTMVDRLPIYSSLDRGDGVCRYFDCSSALCTIYNNRPTICNIDKMYELFFSEKFSREEYYRLNYESCEKFKKEAKGRN